MTTLNLAHSQPLAAPALPLRLVRLVHAVLAWRERARSRAQLAGLNERLLRDVGLDRATAAREVDKSFWQP